MEQKKRVLVLVGLVGVAATVVAYQMYKKLTSEKDIYSLDGPNPSNKETAIEYITNNAPPHNDNSPPQNDNAPPHNDNVTQESKQSTVCDGNVSKCGSTQKLINVISEYHVYMNNTLHGLNGNNKYINKLNQNILSTLNIFHHILSDHNNDQCFSWIYDKLVANNNQCMLNQCKMIFRNRNNYTDINLYKNIDAKLIPIQQILDSIHCHFSHSYDLGYRLRTNKNENEAEQKLPLMKIPSHNKFNSNLGKSIKQKNDADHNSKLPSYSYGFQLYYWEYYKNIKREDKYYVPPKYKHLKDELLTNSISKLDIKKFNEDLAKAQIEIKTEKCRSMKPNIDHYNEKQKVFDMHPIHYGYTNDFFDHCATDHLLSIIIYCKYDQLQYGLKCTLRKRNENESMNSLINRNSNFHFFVKYITEAVNIFGVVQFEGKIDYFYHGIKQDMLFESTSSRIYGILSTTEKFAVAQNFSLNSGLILKLRADPLLKYFPCAWLSEYSAEAESLFVSGFGPFTICNIFDMKISKNYEKYIRSMSVLDSMINSRPFDDDHKIFHKILSKSGYKNINTNPLKVGAKPLDARFKTIVKELIDNELNHQNNFEIDAYISNLFHHICLNKSKVYISWKLMNAEILKKYDGGGYIGYLFLKNIFCGLSDEPELNFKFINKLYPNMTWLGFFDLPSVTLNLLDDIFDFTCKNSETNLSKITLFLAADTFDKLGVVEESTTNIVDEWMAKQTFPLHLLIKLSKISNVNVLRLSIQIV